MVFLQILLAVAIVIFALIAAAFWWFKRQITKTTAEFAEAAKLLEHLDMRPARLHLTRGERMEFSPGEQPAIEELDELGFRRIADLFDYGSGLCIRAARHNKWPIAAAFMLDAHERQTVVLFALDRTRHVVARGSGMATHLEAPRLDWRISPDTTLESALNAVREQLNDQQLPIDLRVIRAVIEQVHALEMDRKIVHEPTRAALERLAEEKRVDITEDQLDMSLEQALEHWKIQIAEAALDRYRRTSGIDAVEWEELNEEIHVVHARLNNQDIESMLVMDDVGQQVYDSCVAQGLSGMELYRAVAGRLPADQQWVELGQVDKPVRAVLFKPNESIGSDERAAGRYLYSAVDSEGRQHQGAVTATSGGDARNQLAQLGFSNVRILMEPAPGGDGYDDMLADDDSAAIAAKAATDSIAVSTLRAIGRNWLIWAPPLVLLAKSLYDGAPYGWGDYVVFVLSALALGATVFLIAPMILYNQLQLAELKAKPRLGMALLRALRTTSIFGAISESELRKERCKLLVMSGQTEKALSIWKTKRGNLSEAEYQTGLVAIFDTAGDVERAMSAQRKLIEISPSPETSTVDLAMSIARYSPDVDEAEKLIQSVSPSHLPEIGVGGYQYARGIIATRRHNHELAFKHYRQALDTFGQFANTPVALGLIAEVNGYVALTLKRSGNRERAAEIWKDVLPILEKHPSMAPLVTQYEAT